MADDNKNDDDDTPCDNFQPAWQPKNHLLNHLVGCKNCNCPQFAHEPMPQALFDAINNPGPRSTIKGRDLPSRKSLKPK